MIGILGRSSYLGLVDTLIDLEELKTKKYPGT